MGLLLNPDDQIRNFAGMLIANILVLEFENKANVTTILESMSSNVSHESENIQKVAILTLGYISEVLHENAISSLDEKNGDLLLSGIFLGLKNFGPLSISSIKSLRYSLAFLKPKLNNESILDFIFENLVKILIEGIRLKNIELIKENLLCLEELCKESYQNI